MGVGRVHTGAGIVGSERAVTESVVVQAQVCWASFWGSTNAAAGGFGQHCGCGRDAGGLGW